MRNLLRNFWNDQAGMINATELVFLGTILVIGIVPGVTALRDAIVIELTEMAQAVNPTPPVNAPDDLYQITVCSDVIGEPLP